MESELKLMKYYCQKVDTLTWCSQITYGDWKKTKKELSRKFFFYQSIPRKKTINVTEEIFHSTDLVPANKKKTLNFLNYILIDYKTQSFFSEFLNGIFTEI